MDIYEGRTKHHDNSIYDIFMALVHIKPASLCCKSSLEELGLYKGILKLAKCEGLTTALWLGTIIVGKKESVNEIVEVFTKGIRGNERHRRLGKALGYSDEMIEQFIRKIDEDEDEDEE